MASTDNGFAPAGRARASKKQPQQEQTQAAPNEPLLTTAVVQESAGKPDVVPRAAAQEQDPGARRIEELRARRKERGSINASGLNQKLSVPESMKDPRFEYRWVNDTNVRHHEMKQRDWDYVDDGAIAQDERNSGTGTRIERIADERTTPAVRKTFLMRKPKEFYEEDKAADVARIKKREQAIVRGEARNAEGQSEPGMYVPSGGMKIAVEDGR